jgi:hypothetical protein
LSCISLLTTHLQLLLLDAHAAPLKITLHWFELPITTHLQLLLLDAHAAPLKTTLHWFELYLPITTHLQLLLPYAQLPSQAALPHQRSQGGQRLLHHTAYDCSKQRQICSSSSNTKSRGYCISQNSLKHSMWHAASQHNTKNDTAPHSAVRGNTAQAARGNTAQAARHVTACHVTTRHGTARHGTIHYT